MGCCANDRFFEMLEDARNVTPSNIDIIRWPGINDHFYVYSFD